MVGVLGQSCVFHTAGHTVRTQHGVTASASQGRVNVELSSYLPDDAAAGAWSSTCPLPTTVLGAVATCSRTVCYRIPRTLMLRLAAQRKINSYRQQYVDNQNISFLPAIAAQAHAYTASFCVFFFYRHTGRPRRTSLLAYPLRCRGY